MDWEEEDDGAGEAAGADLGEVEGEDSAAAEAALAAAGRGEAGEANMKLRDFFSAIDDDAIVAAIGQAEQKTSGQIRVFVSHHKVADPVPAAQKHFTRLGMERTRHRNGVLIFVAPKSHTFAIIGDRAVHEKCGNEFWTRVAADMRDYFKMGQWTQAVTHGIAKAGELLAEHFPREAGGGNELPDGVERD